MKNTRDSSVIASGGVSISFGVKYLAPHCTFFKDKKSMRVGQ